MLFQQSGDLDGLLILIEDDLFGPGQRPWGDLLQLLAEEHFVDVPLLGQQHEPLADAVELAKRISKFSAPILLTGETGSGKNLLAQCIHNESLLRKNAFVTIDCSAWLPETLDNMLFGNYTVRKDSSVDRDRKRVV